MPMPCKNWTYCIHLAHTIVVQDIRAGNNAMPFLISWWWYFLRSFTALFVVLKIEIVFQTIQVTDFALFKVLWGSRMWLSWLNSRGVTELHGCTPSPSFETFDPLAQVPKFFLIRMCTGIKDESETQMDWKVIYDSKLQKHVIETPCLHDHGWWLHF